MSRQGWFEPSRPIRVEGGLRVRSRRGSIGERWWSRRFIDILEGVCDAGRLGRGRSYARSGQVLDLEIGPGLVTARVQGSRRTPYRVRVEIEAYDAGRWRELAGALAAQAVHRAKLLAGEMPPEIEDVFDGRGLPLFPDRYGLEMDCSCPDWGFPCKHLSAVLYVLAERFDDDPFLVLAWRGIARDALLDALRETAGGTSGGDGPARPGLFDVADEPFADRLADFYRPGASPARLRDRMALPDTPSDLLLRVLDAPPVKARHIPLLDLLRPAYRNLARDDES
ncbi:putative Zn finger protein [Streptosporangium becharense]|uniref:Putative Zn finger protein n=1 Tax=Streptosporangium becharense TaxID=1816182 RepID=A0A7W9IKR3_9ACTN|nr:SWIM zinc finger family protein [Streptosporangium becharense]MBB2911700.1 putative Zn finger protein [Streptosporangium becharense]MBB5822482.1 putative Zn finger protein [Streptosporangium becharense]